MGDEEDNRLVSESWDAGLNDGTCVEPGCYYDDGDCEVDVKLHGV